MAELRPACSLPLLGGATLRMCLWISNGIEQHVASICPLDLLVVKRHWHSTALTASTKPNDLATDKIAINSSGACVHACWLEGAPNWPIATSELRHKVSKVHNPSAEAWWSHSHAQTNPTHYNQTPRLRTLLLPHQKVPLTALQNAGYGHRTMKNRKTQSSCSPDPIQRWQATMMTRILLRDPVAGVLMTNDNYANYGTGARWSAYASAAYDRAHAAAAAVNSWCPFLGRLPNSGRQWQHAAAPKSGMLRRRLKSSPQPADAAARRSYLHRGAPQAPLPCTAVSAPPPLQGTPLAHEPPACCLALASRPSPAPRVPRPTSSYPPEQVSTRVLCQV